MHMYWQNSEGMCQGGSVLSIIMHIYVHCCIPRSAHVYVQAQGNFTCMPCMNESIPQLRIYILSLALGAHAQRGLQYVRLSVCLSTLILALQAMRRPMSYTNGFRSTRAWKKRWFSWNDCVREIWRENKRKSQYDNEYSLIAATFSTVFRWQRLLRVF